MLLPNENGAVNTARGTGFDPEALIKRAGKRLQIGAAGSDVVENENGLFYFNHMGDALQNRELAMLRSFPNVIFTPHTAFYTRWKQPAWWQRKAVRAMADGEQTPLEGALRQRPRAVPNLPLRWPSACLTLTPGEPLFVCAGCGDCCYMYRQDLVLSRV